MVIKENMLRGSNLIIGSKLNKNRRRFILGTAIGNMIICSIPFTFYVGLALTAFPLTRDPNPCSFTPRHSVFAPLYIQLYIIIITLKLVPRAAKSKSRLILGSLHGLSLTVTNKILKSLCKSPKKARQSAVGEPN